jgi:hypothetical protein
MKFEKTEPVYQPVKITLESQEELDDFLSLLNKAREKLVTGSSEYNTAILFIKNILKVK